MSEDTRHTAGKWSVFNDNEGDSWPAHPLWCIGNDVVREDREEGDPLHAVLYSGTREDAVLMAASKELLEALEAQEKAELARTAYNAAMNNPPAGLDAMATHAHWSEQVRQLHARMTESEASADDLRKAAITAATADRG